MYDCTKSEYITKLQIFFSVLMHFIRIFATVLKYKSLILQTRVNAKDCYFIMYSIV